MKPWLWAGALLLALIGADLRAGDLESLHAFNFNFGLKPGWTLQLHTRVRTFEDVGVYNQFRTGPILIWEATRRFTSLTGYYIADQNTRVVHERYRIHRVWSGGQYRFIHGEKWNLDGRAALERLLSSRFDDYWRFRTRAVVSRTTRIGLASSTSEAILQQGIWYGRWTGGLQWKLQKHVTFGAGYEYRDAPRGPGSHVIATILQWEVHPTPPAHVD